MAIVDLKAALRYVRADKGLVPGNFDLSSGKNNEFGKGRVKGRHFTHYRLDHDTAGLAGKRLESDIPEKLHMMNPMYFVGQKNPEQAKYR